MGSGFRKLRRGEESVEKASQRSNPSKQPCRGIGETRNTCAQWHMLGTELQPKIVALNLCLFRSRQSVSTFLNLCSLSSNSTSASHSLYSLAAEILIYSWGHIILSALPSVKINWTSLLALCITLHFLV